MKRFARAAFTLTELLVVIAIIVLLLALLLPALANAKGTARAAGCLSNQKQLTLLVHAYSQDWSGGLPHHVYFPPGVNYHDSWLYRLVDQRYLDPLPTFAVSPFRYLDTTKHDGRDIRLCPEVPITRGVDHNNVANDFSFYVMPAEVAGITIDGGLTWMWGLHPIRIDQVKKPATTTSTMDGFIDLTTGQVKHGVQFLEEGGDPPAPSRPNYRWQPGLLHPNYYTYAHGLNYDRRHLKAECVFGFLDGHGERRRFRPDDPYALPVYPGGFGQLLGPLRTRNYDG